MATIAIAPFHWAADLNSTFALARKLGRRGHRVLVFTAPEMESHILEQGFEFRPIFADVFSPGAIENQNRMEAQGRGQGLAGFREKLARMCALLRAGELEKASSDVSPDLLLASSWTPWTAIAAHGAGLRVLSFSSTLISVPDPIVPPFTRVLAPEAPYFRLRTAWAWKWTLFGRKYLRGGLDTRGEMTALARACGYPFEKLDFQVETWPRLGFPELVLCPEPFDFPRERRPANVHFVEASIDLERKEAPFPWERLDSDRPLVYCSLGSIVTIKFRPAANRFLQVFLDAIAARPYTQAVAAIGRFNDPEQFRCPANALIVPEAPQLALLRRAAVHVTHAGMTGVKESLYFGVPMIAAPCFYDQPGNAARIVHHGLGLMASWKNTSAAAMGDLIDRVMSDTAYRTAASRMSEVFTDLETRGPSVGIIERHLPTKDGHRPP